MQAQEGLLAEAHVAHAAQVHQLREQHDVYVDEMKQALSSEFVAQTCVLEAKCRREVLKNILGLFCLGTRSLLILLGPFLPL